MTPLSLDLDQIREMPSQTLQLMDHAEVQRTFKGIPLEELLTKAVVGLGPQLRGKNLAKYVLVTAADDYKVVFSLAELDPLLSGNSVLLAYEMDGKPLDPGYGPLRLVVPQDKSRARWIREVRTIKVLFAD